MSSETKSIPITIRMKPSQVEELKQLANEANQSVSQYGVEHIFQNNGVTDTQLRQVFYALKKIQDTVNFQLESEPTVTSSILKECDAIWQSLKS